MSLKKIAVMGGTFDPVHYGHLASAETVRSIFEFDKIIFIPSGSPPHKINKDVTDPQKRYLMTSYAIAPNANFDISKIEVESVGNSYTIDTVRKIKESVSGAEIYFITGADAVLEIMSWHHSEELLQMCGFIAITRPGYNADKLKSQIEYLKKEKSADISLLEVPALAISSTDIRNRVKNGVSIKYLVPDSVENFIYKYNLYRG
jgi:nicotinate-nucleotide adenylyltransferase